MNLDVRKQLESSLTCAEDLKEKLRLSEEELKECKKIIDRFPMRITPYYFSLIDPNDPDDPIRKMSVPSHEEFCTDGSFDTSGELSNTKLGGLQHKYRETALILSTNTCAMYCRHCFRKRLVGLDESEINRRLSEAVDYVKEHKEISNVLISGGDPLTLPNNVIRNYLDELSKIEHLDLIRIGSRIPVTLPQRISCDSELLDILREFNRKKSVAVVTQFNHPKEFTAESEKAVSALNHVGVLVRNQTVLLKGVNDNPKTLAELFRKITSYGIVPYYLFQCRPVSGVKNIFQVPISRGIEISDAAKSELNGFAKSFRYAMSHPRGKIEIIGKGADGKTIFKFHQSKYPEDFSKIFTVTLNDEDSWLDDDLNGISSYIEK